MWLYFYVSSVIFSLSFGRSMILQNEPFTRSLFKGCIKTELCSRLAPYSPGIGGAPRDTSGREAYRKSLTVSCLCLMDPEIRLWSLNQRV